MMLRTCRKLNSLQLSCTQSLVCFPIPNKVVAIFHIYEPRNVIENVFGKKKKALCSVWIYSLVTVCYLFMQLERKLLTWHSH